MKKLWLSILVFLFSIFASIIIQFGNTSTLELTSGYFKESTATSKTNQKLGTQSLLTQSAATSCGGFDDPYNTYPCCANNGNNTWWAVYTRPDLRAAGLGVIDASEFFNKSSSLGFPEGQIPQVGAIAAWGKSEMYPNGHVGYVIRVFNNEVFQISEMNCDRDPRYNPSRILSTLQIENFQGFIYKRQTGSVRIEVRNTTGQLIQSSISIKLANGQTFGSTLTAGVYTVSNTWAIPAKITAMSSGITVEKEIIINPESDNIHVLTVNTTVLPPVPTLIQPLNTAIFNEGDLITFSWNTTNEDEYRVELSGEPIGTAVFEWQKDNSLKAPILLPGFSYSWRVQSRNSFGLSEWSPSWAFSIAKQPEPTGCSLISGGGVVFYNSENCSGVNQRIRTTTFTKLTKPLNNGVNSIYVKDGWSVKVFENKDKTGGKLCITSTSPNLTELNYSNGSAVVNGVSTISAVKVFKTANCQ